VQLHQPTVLEALAALDAQLLVISFAELSRLGHWVPYFVRSFLAPDYEKRGLTLPADPFARTRFLADPTRVVYHAYGLGRNSVLRVYGPRILWHYGRAWMQGRPPSVQADPLQRGGNFVVGRDGTLTLSHTGRDQADRPSPDAILAALRAGQ
jgi:hypothetical protein